MENIFFDLNKIKYLGVGAIIGKTVRIRKPEDTIIGDYSIIDDFTYISSSLEIGKYAHIASNCTISGGAGKVKIGNFVGISSGSCIYAASSDYVSATLDFPSVPSELKFGGVIAEVKLEDFVLLGSHSVVLPGCHLPEGFASAAATVIRNRKYDPWTLYHGSNCLKLAARDHEELLKRIEKFKKTTRL